MLKYLILILLFVVGCSSSPSKKVDDAYCKILAFSGPQHVIIEFEDTEVRKKVYYFSNGPIPIPGETWYVIYDTSRPDDIRFVRKVPPKNKTTKNG